MRRYFTGRAGTTRHPGRALAIGATMLAVAGMLTGSTSGAVRHATDVGHPTTIDAYVTYYGWYDNTPPGCATAYAGCTGGRGTYSDPITFASDTREFPVGTIVYYPTVQKYFRMRDDCSECDADWRGKGPDGGPRLRHLDLWIGGKGGSEWDVIRCEDALTQAMPSGRPLLTPVIVNPPANLPTSTQQLFNTRTDQCFGGARSQTIYGRYQNQRTSECLTDSGSTSGATVVTAPCSSTDPRQDLAFDGAFFTVGRMCLTARSQHYGSRLLFETCSGHRRQLWETGSSGTISTVQQLACINVVNGIVALGSCRTASSNRGNQWTFLADGRSSQTAA